LNPPRPVGSVPFVLLLVSVAVAGMILNFRHERCQTWCPPPQIRAALLGPTDEEVADRLRTIRAKTLRIHQDGPVYSAEDVAGQVEELDREILDLIAEFEHFEEVKP